MTKLYLFPDEMLDVVSNLAKDKVRKSQKKPFGKIPKGSGIDFKKCLNYKYFSDPILRRRRICHNLALLKIQKWSPKVCKKQNSVQNFLNANRNGK